MHQWTPISLGELNNLIQKEKKALSGELLTFWNLIKIEPTKWIEKHFGNEGGGFWVVAVSGNKVIWYNDIEEGFNISPYVVYGQIEGYFCNQDELSWAVTRLYEAVKFGGYINGQVGPSENLTLD